MVIFFVKSLKSKYFKYLLLALTFQNLKKNYVKPKKKILQKILISFYVHYLSF